MPTRLVIAYAACQSPASAPALAGLALPHLGALLAHQPAQDWLRGEVSAPRMPHEGLLAALAGPAGATPNQARITPTHWSIQANRIDLTDPEGLGLTEEDSRALCAAMQAYFAEDGIALRFESPLCWLADSECFDGLKLASIDRALGHNLLDWLPQGDAARRLRRLQQEMQMLLHTHPVNAARAEHGQLPVNSFWISRAAAAPAGVEVCTDLRRPALGEDWPAWAATWARIDATHLAPLRAALKRGNAVRLSLCGEASSVTLAWPAKTDAAPGLWSGLRSWLGGGNSVEAVMALLRQL